jgi:hypothetical protein
MPAAAARTGIQAPVRGDGINETLTTRDRRRFAQRVFLNRAGATFTKPQDAHALMRWGDRFGVRLLSTCASVAAAP